MRDHEELEMIEVRAELQGFRVELFRGLQLQADVTSGDAIRVEAASAPP